MSRTSLNILCLLAFMLLVAAPVHAEKLVVSAAASLTDAFNDIEPAFEAAHPGVDVELNYASSGALFRQIEQGAPVDVFASANPKWMNKAVDGGFADKAAVKIFARNALVLATPADNPAAVTGVADLSGGKVKTIAIGTPETVPAGQYAKAALTASGVYDTLAAKYIFCESVRQVLDYVVRGEVDCGFVYKTDAVKGGDKVKIIAEVPLEKPVTYPIAVLKEAANAKAAKAFVDFVTSDKGSALLQGRGFNRP
ncbi:MAG: molybdate ABC transporter substrate-binding protein [Desulfovibrionaceae bacterium]